MRGWVDTIVRRDNIWLVLVFHGVDGIGWEPKTGAELEEYFSYIKSLEGRVWVATFQDVTKYMRERMQRAGDDGSEREGDRSRPPPRPAGRDLRSSAHFEDVRAVRLEDRRDQTG